MPSPSIKLNPEKFHECKKETHTEISVQSKLTDFLTARYTIHPKSNGYSIENVPQLMVKDLVVWNKSYGGSVDNQKVKRGKRQHKESVSPIKA